MSGTLTNGIITSDVQHGTKLDKSDMKAVVAIAEPIISALDYAAELIVNEVNGPDMVGVCGAAL